ncbi:XkdX family protein [Niallia alba]|nr:XkdX family protein [Niallia alba]
MRTWKQWISDYYAKGFYTNERMKVFVVSAWITSEEYKEITGVDYST